MTAIAFEVFQKRQAIADALLNLALAGGLNYGTFRKFVAIPALRPFGDFAPSLLGTLCASAFLLSLLLPLIVFGLTVMQRRAGKIEPLAVAPVSWFGPALRVVRTHMVIYVLPTLAITLVLAALNINWLLPPGAAAALVGIYAMVLAWFASLRTTLAASCV